MATANSNPYLLPQSTDETRADTLSSKQQPPNTLIRRRIAIGCLVFAVVSSMAYVYVDVVLLELEWGAWPMLFTIAALAVAVGVFTRDWIIAPLCCFVAAMSGDVLTGFLKSWEYAQVPAALGLSACFSAPALIAAVVSLMMKRRTQTSAPFGDMAHTDGKRQRG